jgi:Rrf2 family transcriptional repressor of oqxAB
MSQSKRGNQIGPPRFVIAVHVLIWLAKSGGLLSSATIAGQVNSHATFLRRVLATLVQSGFVEAREGRDGGYSLSMPAGSITLADVYLAVKMEPCEGTEELSCSGEEGAGIQLDQALEQIMNAADLRTVEYLKQYSIADLTETIDF